MRDDSVRESDSAASISADLTAVGILNPTAERSRAGRAIAAI